MILWILIILSLGPAVLTYWSKPVGPGSAVKLMKRYALLGYSSVLLAVSFASYAIWTDSWPWIAVGALWLASALVNFSLARDHGRRARQELNYPW